MQLSGPVENYHRRGWGVAAILTQNPRGEKGADSMGNTLWFITILKEQPWLGFLIGLVFVAIMFGSKNLIVYFYAKNQEKKKRESERDI